MQKHFLTAVFLFLGLFSFSQEKSSSFTAEDTLRGSLNSNRTWWNVQHYAIAVKPNLEEKNISGSVAIQFAVIGKPTGFQQIDLQEPLLIDSVLLNKQKLAFQKQSANTWLIKTPFKQVKTTNTLIIFYHGKPKEAVRPPWDGGWIWKKDAAGNPFVSVAVQGLGASAWYPCKDHQSDEPELGANLAITVPEQLQAVGNGRLQKITQQNGLTTYIWKVTNTINNYCIIPYIGKYISFHDVYEGKKGKLTLDYWVLPQDSAKAVKQFQQVKNMLAAFEYWFGPYPFYEDGFKLVQAPHLGMEHQSAIAYGNKFMNGYMGTDLSGTGWGKNWDFIIVHESGHEWFANNITTKDIADMWVHEGFTNYSETLFVEYFNGKKAGNEYCYGIRKNIRNDKPIIAPYGVNKEGSGDMYYKAANMIHLIRQTMNNDSVFRKMLWGLQKQFGKKTTTSNEVESYISKFSGIDFTPVFQQYLRTTQIPELQYVIDSAERKIHVRFTNCINNFKLKLIFPEWNTAFDVLEGKWQSFSWQPNWQAEDFYNIEKRYYIKPVKLNSLN
ncbi:MAG: M1 family metallopeptidase [Chitinophagaceae bacterium]